MYSRFQLGFKYLSYLFSSTNGKGHGIHSPFVFDFITKVLNDKTAYSAYHQVETFRGQLLNDNSVLKVDDPGAGSSVTKANQRSISSIAKNAAKPKKFGQLLFRIIKYYQPKTIIELGTSLGITTSYLCHANPVAKLITMEGSQAIASVAERNFETQQLNNVQLVLGNFDSTLSSVVRGLSSIDFAFIDGNHRKEPTERYFKQLLERTTNDSILVFDDIHWSKEMEQAWEIIKDDHRVTCSIDLFFIGIIFFRAEFRAKQHFTIRF